ncbi:L,D-transpeptidase family protein [Agilicoccus flavus]|uniref:L,D-transpeptidase family protein n=1 Tax=Agilicoccus flavus TaxID=2775968 RepID=UPI001CF699BE|nr:L,D-transpeptidase family protein [Agilicoccus flavus]
MPRLTRAALPAAALVAALALAAGPAAPSVAAPAAGVAPHSAVTPATTVPASTTRASTTTSSTARRAAASAADRCARIAAGRVKGLTTRPAAVTFALATAPRRSTATVTRCVRRANGTYARAWSVPGRVGRAGFAPVGAKREGDGRSPTGAFRLGVAFGAADPGSRLGYLTLGRTSCWGSTVGARTYNRYFRGRCGAADESMYSYVRGAYAQGMLIRYNTDPIRQGRGSAIFLHASTGGPTAGCVSVPRSYVTSTIRASRPGDVVVMGVASERLR